MIKKLIIVFIILNIIISCASTKYVAIPLSKPPDKYMPNIIATEKDVVREYQRALIQIANWQGWYNINVGSNYYTNNN